MSSLFSRGRGLAERMLWPNVSSGDDIAPEIVTVYVHRTGDKFTKIQNVTAFRRAIREELDTTAISQIQEGEVNTAPSTIHLRASTLPAGTIISYGCKIVDAAGDTWLVIRANLETLDTRWRCTANKAPRYNVST